MWNCIVGRVRPVTFDGQRRISTNLRPILSFAPCAMVGIDWIGPIWPPCKVTGWRYISPGLYGQEVMNLQTRKPFMIFGSTSLFLFFGFPLCIFHDNGSHFTGAEITAFFKDNGTTQIRAPISHPSSVGLVERNVELVISQVRKWILDWGPGVKTNWGRSIPEILPPINGRLIRLHLNVTSLVEKSRGHRTVRLTGLDCRGQNSRRARSRL